MNCHNCGSQINEDSTFCQSCGAKQMQNVLLQDNTPLNADTSPKAENISNTNNKLCCPLCGTSEPEPTVKVEKKLGSMAGCGTMAFFVLAIFVSLAITGLVSEVAGNLSFVVFFVLLILAIIFCVKVLNKRKTITISTAICQKCGNIWEVSSETKKETTLHTPDD